MALALSHLHTSRLQYYYTAAATDITISKPVAVERLYGYTCLVVIVSEKCSLGLTCDGNDGRREYDDEYYFDNELELIDFGVEAS